MSPPLHSGFRAGAYACFLAACAFAAFPPRPAGAQAQQKCYYMECIGTSCFAYQIECPKLAPAPQPIAPSTAG
jgi:hypothetical protein